MAVEKLLTSSSLGRIPSPGTPKVKSKWAGCFLSLTESKYCVEGLLSVAVTTCLTFELVVLKRGKSTLEEEMQFPWLIDWLTPPSLSPSLRGLPSSLTGLFAMDDGLSNLLHQARGMPGCRICSVFTGVSWSHFPALGGHVRSLTKDCLIAEVESSEESFLVTGTKVCTEHVQEEGMTRQLLRLSLPLLGGHVIRGLVGPRNRPPWASVYLLPLKASAHASLLWLDLLSGTLH